MFDWWIKSSTKSNVYQATVKRKDNDFINFDTVFIYNIRVKNGRDKLQQALKDNEIAYAVYYPLCLHQQEVYKELGYKTGDFPVSERSENEVLALPMYPELTDDEVRRVIRTIQSFFEKIWKRI